MIEITFAKQILNALFKTGGVAGISAADEKSKLVAAGIPWAGRNSDQYGYAFVNDGYKTTGPTTTQFNKEKSTVNASENYRAVTTDAKNFKYDDINGDPATKSFTGWEIELKTDPEGNPTPTRYYPDTTYLALFTTMPDERGMGYVEPASNTTYMRVNLLKSILTGGKSMTNASENEGTGVTSITNGEQIYFPEVFGVDWGTIVGIGVFTEKEVGTGTPLFWGRINDAVAATNAHVPLFREGDLKVTLN